MNKLSSLMVFRKQSGINLIELMIGLAIGLFVLLGLVRVFDNTRVALSAQSGVANLQEKQRQTMTFFSQVIQSAGSMNANNNAYPPMEPEAIRRAFFVARAGNYAAGAVVFGTDNSVRVRFQRRQGDGVLDCHGNLSSSATPEYVTNVYSVAGENLVCATGTDSQDDSALTSQALIDKVSSMSVTYGVRSDASPIGNTGAKGYFPASAIDSNTWSKVDSVKVGIQFKNPLAGQPGQAATVGSVYVIRLMGST